MQNIRCVHDHFTLIRIQILENGLGEADSVIIDRDNDPASVLMQLARDTEQLAMFERRSFSPVLRRWHPAPVAVAAVTLHGCFGVVLRQYLAKVTILTEELVRVLHTASRLEKALAQMTAEDAADCDDGRAKAVVGDMEPFEVESVVMGLLKAWMDDKLGLARDCLLRARDTEVPPSFLDATASCCWNFIANSSSSGELTITNVLRVFFPSSRAGYPSPKKSPSLGPAWS